MDDKKFPNRQPQLFLVKDESPKPAAPKPYRSRFAQQLQNLANQIDQDIETILKF